ncbi:N-acetylneuraminate synthase [Algicola sagamiensis]|uniref:N-acetylneuraminate synthase n=1 Tax=Algicola sagamiensis TaxID=163869 RepID=UPI000366AF69|nr:N-acetylneuraminate synthase [Algicola sagamiensis]
MKQHVKVIAEVGVNHNAQLSLAKALVDIALDAGADIVKFQTFVPEELATAKAEKATYQKQETQSQSQLEMLKQLSLSFDDFCTLKSYCDQRGIEFLSTAFDTPSLMFLTNQIGQRRFKIPSGEINNAPFVFEHAKSAQQLIISTGMATLGEIENALSVAALGFLYPDHPAPSIEAFQEAYSSTEGQQALKERVTILHCTSQYPAPVSQVNLNVLPTLAQAFGCAVGYSDHTAEVFTPAIAVAKGATLIEKHFTLDRSLPGPDHQASMEPNELKEMIRMIRVTESMLGHSTKAPQQCEFETKAVARKSLVALKPIRRGDVFSEENMGVKRPGTGISPTEYWQFLGTIAGQDYDTGDLL